MASRRKSVLCWPNVRGHVPLGVSEHARQGATGGDQWTKVFPSKSCGMRGDTINDVAHTTLLAGLTRAVGLAQHQPGHGEAAGSPSGVALARPSAQEDLGATPRGLSPGCWFPGQAPQENRGVTTVYTQPQESDGTSVVSTRSPERSGGDCRSPPLTGGVKVTATERAGREAALHLVFHKIVPENTAFGGGPQCIRAVCVRVHGCVYMCAYVRVHARVCACIRVHVCIHGCIMCVHVWVRACMCVHVHVCVHGCMCVHMDVCMWVHMDVCMWVGACVHVCVFMCASRVCTWVGVCMCALGCVRMYTCVHVCMCMHECVVRVYVCAYVCIHGYVTCVRVWVRACMRVRV